jgi:uncharacterized protein YceK
MKKLALVLAVVAVSGCASVINGKTQTIGVNSNAQGATVSINGKSVGVTPFIGPVERPSGSGGVTVTLSKDGYQSKTVTMDTGIAGAFWGNILIGGGLGSTTDFSSNSMYKYSQDSINVDLVKAEGK